MSGELISDSLRETLKDAFKNPERAFFGIHVWVIHGSLQMRHPWRGMDYLPLPLPLPFSGLDSINRMKSGL